jgi:hypothetical protein
VVSIASFPPQFTLGLEIVPTLISTVIGLLGTIANMNTSTLKSSALSSFDYNELTEKKMVAPIDKLRETALSLAKETIDLEVIFDLADKAEWRHECYRREPEEPRYLEAARLFERFAEEADELIGGEMHGELSDIARRADGEEFGDAVNYMLRGVGFDYFPATAEQLLRDTLRSVRSVDPKYDESDE